MTRAAAAAVKKLLASRARDIVMSRRDFMRGIKRVLMGRSYSYDKRENRSLSAIIGQLYTVKINKQLRVA